MKLYKYASPGLLEHALSPTGEVCLKFDHPRNYNDPLELFLTLRGHESDPQVIAYYREILGEVPQLPTTCFSKRPDIIPMWAHYGDEHAGFVMEFEETALSKAVPIGYLEDVAYVDETGFTDWGVIRYAAGTLKPRHTYAVQTEALKKAYFTKNHCWRYEQERRMVVESSNFKNDGDLMILRVSSACLTAVITGVRSSRKQRAASLEAAKRFQCSFYEMKIGRSSCSPYFVDEAGVSFVFDGAHIGIANRVCAKCSEPLNEGGRQECQWCSINEGHKAEAHMNNPFTIIDRLGLRQKYGYGLSFGDLIPIGSSVAQGTEQ